MTARSSELLVIHFNPSPAGRRRLVRNPEGGADFTLSADQEDAVNTIIPLLVQRVEGADRTMLVLAGYAGSGKSTVMKVVCARLKAAGVGYVLLAPTGKAAARLRETTGESTATVHSFLYTAPTTLGVCPSCEETSPDLAISDREARKQGITSVDCPHCKTKFSLSQLKKIKTTIGFAPGKGASAHAGPMVAIIDEASMISIKRDKDIRSLLPANYSVLYVGDDAQLPPIPETAAERALPLKERWGPNFAQPTARLTKVHRQAADNPIIDLATRIRENKNRNSPFHFTVRDPQQRVKVVRGPKEQAAAWLAGMRNEKRDATLICYSNRLRQELNHLVRQRRGLETEAKRTGLGLVRADRLLVLKNNRGAGLMNGEVVLVEASRFPRSAGLRDEGFIFVKLWKMDEEFLINGPTFGQEVKEFESAVGVYTNVFNRMERKVQRVMAGQDDGWDDDEDIDEIAQAISEMDADELFDAYGAIRPRQALHADFGECITTHKCVHPDTIVETELGLQPIRTIAPNGTIATPEGPAPYQNLIVNPPCTMLRLETESGYTLTVTPEHGLDVWSAERETYARVEAAQLDVGDFLRLKLGATIEPSLPSILPGAPWADSRATTDATLPHFTTPELAEWLGMFVADGTLYDRGFRLVKRHQDVVDRFARLTRELFSVAAHVDELSPDKFEEPVFVCEVNSAFLTAWLRSVGGLHPHAKWVPDCVLRAHSSIQAAFLRGISIDGSVHVKDGTLDHIEIQQSSPGLVPLLRTMLLRLGIVSGRARGGVRYDNLQVYGMFAKLFVERVGLVADLHIQRAASARQRDDARRYRVPVGREEVKRLHQRGEMPHSDYNNALTTGYISRAKAAAVPGLVDRLDFQHERIVSIEPVEAPSLCVEVPAGHRFLQNGFSGWNSQGSQWKNVGLVWDYVSQKVWDNEYEEGWRWTYTSVTRASERLVVFDITR